MGVRTTEEHEGRKKVKRVRRASTSPDDDRDDERGDPRPSEEPAGWEGDFDGDDADIYRFVTVPRVEGESHDARSSDPMKQQAGELFNDFDQHVGDSEETFRQFMFWAAEADGVVFEDLLISIRSVYDMMSTQLPCGKEAWDEFVEMANLVEVSTVSDSELEYALEVFSKTYDLYRSELRRLDEERTHAEQLSFQRISDEILAEDDGALGPDASGDQSPALPEGEAPLELERWDKLVDDTRMKINSTKAEFDELVEELNPPKDERERALAKLRVLDKDAKRKHGRLERYQRGRISEAKATEIQNLERELVSIEDEQADWNSRLSIAQERIDQRIALCAEKRREFIHIKNEVVSVLDSLPAHDRVAVSDALAGEIQDLSEIIEDADGWLTELTSESLGGDDSASILDMTPPVGEAAAAKADAIASEVVERPSVAQEELPGEPPVVFMDAEVRRMLADLPIERPPEEELLLRIEDLQQQLINRENTIMEMEHSVERLMEDREGSATAVELERNKIKLELNKVQEELSEKQGLLEQYLDVIRNLEGQMEGKDRDLRETLVLNRRKTDELRQKEAELQAVEREIVEKQEEFRQERQELHDREARLNAQVSEKETQDREMAKKDLTLELRNEQIRKKLDRLTARELELQRITGHQKESEEMLSLKEQELQSLKTELDVREEEQRRRETAIEERSSEVKKLQSEVSKLEHRVRSRDETLRRREAHMDEDEDRIRRLESSIAEREVQLRDREDEVNLREAKAESALASLDSQRDEQEAIRREVTKERQEAERLRVVQDQRHDELIRREDAISVREDTLRERERATQLQEDRLELERDEVKQLRTEYDDIETKWSAREKNLLERLGTFNSEKEELMGDWKAAKARVRELEHEKTDLTARLIAAESSLMNKDGEILAIAKELEEAQGRSDDTVVELDEGVKTSLQRIMEDVERQHVELAELESRAARVEGREKELIEMEEILNTERERVRELLAEQESGQADLQEALDQLASRSSETGEMETSLKDREDIVVSREEDLARREEVLRQREREMDRLTTAEDAEARAEDREEELMDLQRELEDRTASLESREEELEQAKAQMGEQLVELERQKREVMLARENILKSGHELEGPPPDWEILDLEEESEPPRQRSSLAMRAALMVAQSRQKDGEEAVEAGEEGTEQGEGSKVLARLRCKACETVIPIYTKERPIEIVCPSCGREGVLK